MLLEEGGLPGEDAILSGVFVAVLLSVLAHGVTAAPLSRRYGDWAESHPQLGAESLETRETAGVPWRLPVGKRETG